MYYKCINQVKKNDITINEKYFLYIVYLCTCPFFHPQKFAGPLENVIGPSRLNKPTTYTQTN